jgi:hypothetical protein
MTGFFCRYWVAAFNDIEDWQPVSGREVWVDFFLYQLTTLEEVVGLGFGFEWSARLACSA